MYMIVYDLVLSSDSRMPPTAHVAGCHPRRMYIMYMSLSLRGWWPCSRMS